MRSLPYILLVSVLLLVSCSEEELSERLSRNAKELLYISDSLEFKSNSNSPTTDIVNIGPGLHQVLLNRNTPVDSITIEIHDGDLFGSRQNVSHSIKYKAQDSEIQLILRMRYDKHRDKFHIVGYTGELFKSTKNEIIDTNAVFNIISLQEYLIRENREASYSEQELQRMKESINYDSIIKSKDLPIFEVD